MIDLTRALPDSLEVDGGRVPIYTGFRTWLRFDRNLGKWGMCDPCVLRDPSHAPDGWQDAALVFLRCPEATPRGSDPGGEELLDLSRDGSYIVGSFQQAYGIDLTDAALELHWHRFLALLRSLPESTKLASIVGWRAWTPADERRRPEAAHRGMHDMWALPHDDDAELLELQQRLFGGIRPEGVGE